MVTEEKDVVPVGYLSYGKEHFVRVVGQDLEHVLPVVKVSGGLTCGMDKKVDEIIRYTEFDIGFMKLELAMINLQTMGNSLPRKYKAAKKEFPNKYAGVLAINKNLWLWYATDDLDKLDIKYTQIITRIGRGDEVSIDDLLKLQKPVSVSVNGVKYE